MMNASAGVHWKLCNSTLMAVYYLLLQLAAALSAHHECKIELLSAQSLGAFSLVPGLFQSSSLRARACWMRLLMILTAACVVLLLRMYWRETSDFAARWGCCREMSLYREILPRDLL